MELTIDDVAARLRVPIETVMRWIRQGKIPMQHTRGEYTIRQEMLERWAKQHRLRFDTQTRTEENCNLNEPEEGILPAMKRGGVFHGVSGEDKNGVLTAAVALLPNIADQDRDAVQRHLLEREGLASTGIGYGIALPHPRSNPAVALAAPQISTCFLARPVDFDAIDHKPVSILMILLSCSTRQHLSLLSRIAFHLRDQAFRGFLLTAPSREVFFREIETIESN